MTIHLPNDIGRDILAEVQSGHFASVDDAMTVALCALRLQSLEECPQAARKPLTEQELERRLLESGFLASVPPPADTVALRWSFEPVKIEGEPLSETVIRERR